MFHWDASVSDKVDLRDLATEPQGKTMAQTMRMMRMKPTGRKRKQQLKEEEDEQEEPERRKQETTTSLRDQGRMRQEESERKERKVHKEREETEGRMTNWMRKRRRKRKRRRIRQRSWREEETHRLLWMDEMRHQTPCRYALMWSEGMKRQDKKEESIKKQSNLTA